MVSDDMEGAITPPIVTFVIITRNEEKRIEKCLDSIILSATGVQSSEIILVDSRSNDSTVEIAQRFPITIIRLADGVELSPSAGRTAGTQLARGQFIMYVDGDMILAKEWVARALALLQSDKDIGALFGALASKEENQIANSESISNNRPGNASLSMTSSDRVAGAFMVRRTAMEIAGGMNPYLTGDEEADLSYRIKAAGFRIGKTKEMMAIHPPRMASTIDETMRRYRHGYFKGQGRVLRVSLRQGRTAFFHHLWRLKVYEAYGIWLLAGVGALIASVIWTSPRPLVIWALFTACGIISLGVRHGIRDTPRRLLSSFFVALGFVQIAFEKIPDREDFPTDHEIIKRNGSNSDA